MLQVLAEAHARRVDADAAEEQPRVADEVGERLVGDDALRDSVAERHRLGLLLVAHLQRAALWLLFVWFFVWFFVVLLGCCKKNLERSARGQHHNNGRTTAHEGRETQNNPHTTNAPVQQRLQRRDGAKLGVALVVGVDKVLDLGLCVGCFVFVCCVCVRVD